MPDDLRILKTKMQACTLCKGLELGPNPIFQLDDRARILIAGQAPGRVTHAKNRPFDDPSGERLRAWLGVDRSTFYDREKIAIFPMGLCFPGSAPGGDKPPRPECAQAWRPAVMRALRNIELTLVLGKYAIDWHLPALKGKPVTAAVKLASSGLQGVFVLPHPSPRNNRWLKQNEWFEAEVLPRIRSRTAELLRGSIATEPQK